VIAAFGLGGVVYSTLVVAVGLVCARLLRHPVEAH
jgi:hypothetical protein